MTLPFDSSTEILSSLSRTAVLRQFTSGSEDADEASGLDDLSAATTEPIFHFGQAFQPSNSRLRRNVQLDQPLTQSGQDIGERQALVEFDGVDCVETAGDIGRLQQCLKDGIDVAGMRSGDTVVHGRLGDEIALDVSRVRPGFAFDAKWRAAGVTCLKDVQSSPHIPFAQRHQRIDGAGRDVYALRLDHVLDQASNIGLFERTESEAGTS